MGYFFLLLNLIPHIFFSLPSPLLPTFSLFPLFTPTPTIYTPFKSKVVFFLVSLLLSLLVLFCLRHICFVFLIFPISPALFFFSSSCLRTFSSTCEHRFSFLHPLSLMFSALIDVLVFHDCSAFAASLQ